MLLSRSAIYVADSEVLMLKHVLLVFMLLYVVVGESVTETRTL